MATRELSLAPVPEDAVMIFVRARETVPTD
jgi:hypothetical protein